MKAGEDPSSAELAIHTHGLGKSFGSTRAVDALDIAVPAGQFFGLLGPNGSGKTTTIHMLATLVRPTDGEAFVAGHDVVRDPVEVRRKIGLVFQDSALDRTLTVSENLRFAGMLQGLSRTQIRERADEVLELFSLSDRRTAKLASLSGGMRRALDIARGVLHRPDILFLDEPTLGLDVPSRRDLWRYIDQLRRDANMTVFLTTHYLEEAESCDRVAFLADGRIVGSGSPTSLIDALGSYIVEVQTDDSAQSLGAITERFGPGLESGDKMIFRVQDASFDGTSLQAGLDGRVRSVSWRRPTLNEVFLWTVGPGLDTGIS